VQGVWCCRKESAELPSAAEGQSIRTARGRASPLGALLTKEIGLMTAWISVDT